MCLQWSALTSLESLTIKHPNCNATLPASWSALTSLTRLQLNTVGCAGPLPGSWSSLSKLRTLALDLFNVSEPFPLELQASFSDSLETVRIGENRCILPVLL